MIRNKNPFTDRQLRLLDSIRQKILEIEDPNPDVIRHDRYEFYTTVTKRYGKIVKIRFMPLSRSTAIKAELAGRAKLFNKTKREQLEKIRKKYSIKAARNTDAMLFEEEWNNLMIRLKRYIYFSGIFNQYFTTGKEQLARPIKLIQQIVLEEYPLIKAKRDPIHTENPETSEFRRIRPYTDELAEYQ